MFETIYEGNVNFVIAPMENPFRGVTHYHEEAKKESSWSCCNTHLYVVQGWKEGATLEGGKMSVKQVRDNLKAKGKGLI